MFNKYITINIKLDPKDEQSYCLNKKKYTDLAIAFDSIRTSNEISNLRQQLKLENPMSTVEYSQFIREIYNTEKYIQLKNKIEQARKNAMLPFHFGNAMLVATYCDCVNENSYVPVITQYSYNNLYDFRQDFDVDGEIEETICHLIVSPMTRNEDVIDALNKYKQQLGDINGGATGYEYISKTFVDTDNLKTINITREWFLLKEQGMSVEKIRELFESKCPYGSGHVSNDESPGRRKRLLECTCYSTRDISEQIKEYRKLISTPPKNSQ